MNSSVCSKLQGERVKAVNKLGEFRAEFAFYEQILNDDTLFTQGTSLYD